jgi:hypothetical protein
MSFIFSRKRAYERYFGDFLLLNMGFHAGGNAPCGAIARRMEAEGRHSSRAQGVWKPKADIARAARYAPTPYAALPQRRWGFAPTLPKGAALWNPAKGLKPLGTHKSLISVVVAVRTVV